MTRTSARPICVVGLVALVFGYIGCSRNAAPPPTAGASQPPAAEPKAERPDKSKDFADWNPEPAGVLIVSGQQNGYLEPCGCTQGQLGGLLRRYELFRYLREDRKWPIVAVDLGSVIKDPAGGRAGFEQTKFKFMFGLRALALLKYSAIAMSADDLKLGAFETLGLYTNLDDNSAKSSPTKVVVANVTAAAFDQIVPSVRAAAGPVRIGITAVLDDPEVLASLAEQKDLVTITPIEQALPPVLTDLEKDTDVQVLLVQGPTDRATALAKAYPGFDVVVTTSHLEPAMDADTLNDGKTMVVSAGEKGKYVGAIGLFPGKQPMLRYHRIALDTRYDGEAKPMRQLVRDELRETYKSQKLVANVLRRNPIDAAPGAKFVGADACKKCHPKAFDVWYASGHARAFESLEKDEKPNTQYDVECVSCHTTGFELNSGWVSAEETPNLKGNQCENCHGPASRHVENPDNRDFRKAIHLTAQLAEKNHSCLQCHDEDNSPKFEFEKYWAEIAHSGLDQFENTKDPAAKTKKAE